MGILTPLNSALSSTICHLVLLERRFSDEKKLIRAKNSPLLSATIFWIDNLQNCRVFQQASERKGKVSQLFLGKVLFLVLFMIVTFLISVAFMNPVDVNLQRSCLSKIFSSRFTFVIFVAFMKCVDVVLQSTFMQGTTD